LVILFILFILLILSKKLPRERIAMTSVLITAFEPYDRWKTNASWLALIQMTQNLPEQPEITTRSILPR